MYPWDQLKQSSASAILSGGYPFAQNVWYVGQKAPTFGRRLGTIAEAFGVNGMASGDLLFLGPQDHTEGNLVIPSTLTNITIIGAGNRNACRIVPSGASDEGLQVLANDVTLINVAISKGATGDYALRVGSVSIAPSRFNMNLCRIYGAGVAMECMGALDFMADDCEFGNGATAFQLTPGLGINTNIQIRRSRFYDYTTVGLGESAATEVVDALDLWDCIFERQDDGTAPTDFINLSSNSNSGCIHGNRFATATNAASVLTIGTGIFWMANATEAGWSTARPV